MPPKLSELIETGVNVSKGELDKAGKTVQKNIPFGGKIYSEHWGSAADYKRKKRIQEYKAKKRRMEKALDIPNIPNIPDLDFEKLTKFKTATNLTAYISFDALFRNEQWLFFLH